MAAGGVDALLVGDDEGNSLRFAAIRGGLARRLPFHFLARETPAMARLRFVALLALTVTGCGGSKPAITAPSSMTVTAGTPTPTGGMVAMKGTVADRAFRSRAGASVEVLDGLQAGLTTTTDARGEFSFSGTFDDGTRFRATKDGYAPSIQPLQSVCTACNPNRWVHFSLELLIPSVNMEGEYTVTFNTLCASLPNEVRTRTYEATIVSVPSQSGVNIPLRGGTFVKGWDSLPMGVASDYVAFWIEILVEQITPSSYLTFNAVAAANVGTAVQSTFTFPLDGSIDYCVTNRETGTYEDCHKDQSVTHVRCTSGQLILSRR
jgi:hypothetical protein